MSAHDDYIPPEDNQGSWQSAEKVVPLSVLRQCVEALGRLVTAQAQMTHRDDYLPGDKSRELWAAQQQAVAALAAAQPYLK